MSRIGRAPIAIPAGVEIKIEENNVVTVKGPKGTLTRQFHPNMTIAQEGAELKVTRPNDAKENRALHGLTRTLLHNMVVGVTYLLSYLILLLLTSRIFLHLIFPLSGYMNLESVMLPVHTLYQKDSKHLL